MSHEELQKKYERLFQKVKELRSMQNWVKMHGGRNAIEKMYRLQREVDALITIEVTERKS